MSQTFRVRKTPVSQILSSFLTKYTPEISKNIEKISNETEPYRMFLNKISIGSREGLFFTALYADLIKHRLSEDEIKATIYGGALMRVVDDIYDYGNNEEISDFVKFTKPIIQSTINGDFSDSKNSFIFENNYPYSLDPGDSNGKMRLNLDKLSFYLYCSLIRFLEQKSKQRTNLAICLQRIQKTQELYQKKKEKGNLNVEILKKISIDKGGYTVLLPGYLIDSSLPSLSNEELYEYFDKTIEDITDVGEQDNSKYFWRRQFLYLNGGFMQLLDDKRDKTEDENRGIITIASKDSLSKGEERKLHDRLIKIFECAFKEDMSKLKYYWYLKMINRMYHRLLEI